MKIRVNNIRQRSREEPLRRTVAKRLGIAQDAILSLNIVRESVDSRSSRPVRVINVAITVTDAEKLLRRFAGDPQVFEERSGKRDAYGGPQVRLGSQPVVVGTGPAGLFLTLALIEKGYRPIVLERGKPVRPRWKDVNAYWRRGELNPESNVVFGDGGAGTFSDGKLYTRRNDPRNDRILSVFAELAEAKDILTAGRPHLGTNRLSRALLSLHERLAEHGVEVRFEHRLDDLVIADGRIRGVVTGDTTIETDAVFLGTGHSARDVYRMLERHGVAMEARPFAVGARAEHPQTLINLAQLGTATPEHHAADYMLSFNDKAKDRASYTFCMCPGGEIVAAGTEPDGLTVNGMSYSHRADRFGNAAVVATVKPEDFGAEGPLAGLEFQRRLEVAAYNAGGGGHVAPAQRIPDFLAGKASSGDFETSYRRGVVGGNLTSILPPTVVAIMQRGMRHFGKQVAGYDGNEGVLIGVETRTSSPVRILRDTHTYQSVNVAGLYPVGEGAGFAGGIMSSASDGMRAAERIATRSETP